MTSPTIDIDNFDPQDYFNQCLTIAHRGRIRVRNAYQAAMQGTVVQVGPVNKDTIPDGFQPASATLDLSKVKFDHEISGDPRMAAVPIDEPYHPEFAEPTFIPNSSVNVPPIMAASAIKAAAEGVALAKHQNKPTEGIVRLLKKIWDLPDDFDISPYVPMVNPKKQKPWLRYDKDDNYEVNIYRNIQCAIIPTTGSYTRTSDAHERNVDWAKVRNEVRNIMSLVFLVEHGRFAEYRYKTEKPKLEFIIEMKNFPKAYEPQWAWKEPRGNFGVKMSQDDKNVLDRWLSTDLKKYIQIAVPSAKLIPNSIMAELRRQAEIEIKKIIVKPKAFALDLNFGELVGPVPYAPVAIKLTREELAVKRPGFHNILLAALRSFIQARYNQDPGVHKAAAYLEYDMMGKAAEVLLTLIPSQLVNAAIKLWHDRRKAVSVSSAQKIIYLEFFDDLLAMPNFDQNSVGSMFYAALNTYNQKFMHTYLSAYRSVTHKAPKLTIFDFIPAEKKAHGMLEEEKTIHYKQHIYEKISKFYSGRYYSKQDALRSKLVPGIDHDARKDILDEIVKYQYLYKVYPHLGYRDENKLLRNIHHDMAARYIQKRPKLRDVNLEECMAKPGLTTSIMEVSSKTGMKMFDLYNLAMEKSEMTKHDCEKFFDNTDESYVTDEVEDTDEIFWKKHRKVKNRGGYKGHRKKLMEVFSEYEEIQYVSLQALTTDNEEDWEKILRGGLMQKNKIHEEPEPPDLEVIDDESNIEPEVTVQPVQTQSYDDGGLDFMDLLESLDDTQVETVQGILISDWIESTPEFGFIPMPLRARVLKALAPHYSFTDFIHQNDAISFIEPFVATAKMMLPKYMKEVAEEKKLDKPELE